MRFRERLARPAPWHVGEWHLIERHLRVLRERVVGQQLFHRRWIRRPVGAALREPIRHCRELSLLRHHDGLLCRFTIRDPDDVLWKAASTVVFAHANPLTRMATRARCVAACREQRWRRRALRLCNDLRNIAAYSFLLD